MPTIPSTKPGIMRPSSSSTSRLSALPPLMASLLSLKVPLKLTTATSPRAAARSATGTRVAIWRRVFSSISSTTAGSNSTASASAWSPLVVFSDGVGATSSSRLSSSSWPGSKAASRLSKPPLSSGWPMAFTCSWATASRKTLSTSSSRAVAFTRRGPICCNSTGRGTLPLRKPGSLMVRLSFSRAAS